MADQRVDLAVDQADRPGNVTEYEETYKAKHLECYAENLKIVRDVYTPMIDPHWFKCT